MRKSIDVTSEYLDVAAPETGTIIYEQGYNSHGHQEEIAAAEWLKNTFGGTIKLLVETPGGYGKKRPDYEWNGRLWELKTLKSEKSVDSALRKAISQIYDMPGGVILDFGKNHVILSKVESAVKSRVESSCRFKIDIMIVCAGKVKKVVRYA